ncbi:MAG: HD domain-containing protein [Proteobacteria bacterium]|nr:HD domain-containing protein [Pseudomonadota bacterium]MBU2227987.1 HD domain-containing protein [Pseudomonadota bacterium]MBU2262644.1 HD domain-containing protein [Pseudomonadota bacterium]
MPFVIKTALTSDPDPAHNEQVTLLALALFDGLRVLHGYGPEERRLLEIAARLHDIGWSRAGASGKHHKLSCEMIQELAIPGLSGKDRLTCALVARYHNKSLPDASRHKLFASLNNGRRAVVEWLAGMLRVADGLDCNHAGPVRQLTCAVSSKAITIHIEFKGDCRMGLERAFQKQELLVRITGRTIEYRC